MTDGRDPAADAGADPTSAPAETADGPAPGARRQGAGHGLTSFTIEGRRAPALFVVGWLATLMGVGTAVIGYLAGTSPAASVLVVLGLAVLALGLVAAAGSQTLERAAGHAAYRGPSPVLVFAAVLPATIVLVVSVFGVLGGLGFDPDGPEATLVGLLLTVLVYVGSLRLLVVGTGALTWSDMGIRRPSAETVEDVAWGLVLALPVLFGTGVLGLILQQFLPPPPNVLPPATDTAGVVANLIAAAVVAPIGEELFFRGFATTAWVRLDGVRAALVRGAVFFALAHTLTLSGETAGQALGVAAFAFVLRLPVALALGWVFLRRRSLYGAIALHGLFNGLQVLALAASASGAGG